MRLSALLASLTLVALLFAGCSGDGDGDGDATSSSSSSSRSSSTASSTSQSATGTTSSSTTSTGAGANKPPKGSISVSVNGTDATFSLNGTDQDGDELSWELDFGDGSPAATGSELPANATHVYAVGNHTASVSITDGTDAAEYNVTVTVAGGGGRAATQDAVVEYPLGQSFCNGDYPEEGADLMYGVLAVEPGTIGKPFTASWAFTVPGSVGVQVVFIDADGGNAGEAANVLVTELTGEVPEGAVTAWFSDCGPGGPATVTYHAG